MKQDEGTSMAANAFPDQHDPARRMALRAAAAWAVRSATPVSIGVLAATAPGSAQAYWQAILMIASTIMSMVAAANRSDGGLGAVLSASLDYQRSMSNQLLSLQDAVGRVLIQLSQLKSDIQQEFKIARLRELRAAMERAFSQYDQEARERASQFTGGYVAWRADSNTQDSLRHIDEMLRDATHDLKNGGLLDPWTVLYLPVAANVALAVRKARFEENGPLRAEAQFYLDIFEAAESAAVPGSTKRELQMLNEDFKHLEKELLTKSGLVVPKEAKDKETLLALVGTFEVRSLIAVPGRRFHVCGPRRNDGFPDCEDHQEYVTKVESTTTYAALVKVKVDIIKAAESKEALEIVQYTVQEKEVSAVPYKQEDYPTEARRKEPLVGVSSLNLGTEQLRQKYASEKVALLMQKPIEQLTERIDRLNINIAKSALCISALAASTRARRDIYRAFGITEGVV